MDESKVIEGEWHEIKDDEDEEIEVTATDETEPEYPIWYDGKHLDEVKFCAAFLREHPMICVRGEFFTVDGPVSDEDEIRKQILDMIKPTFSIVLCILDSYLMVDYYTVRKVIALEVYRGCERKKHPVVSYGWKC